MQVSADKLGRVTFVLETELEVSAMQAMVQEYVLDGAHPGGRGIAHELQSVLISISRGRADQAKKEVR